MTTTCTIDHDARMTVTLPLSAYAPDGHVATHGTVAYSHPDHGFMCGKCLRDHDLYAGSPGVFQVEAWMVVRRPGQDDHRTCDHCGVGLAPWLD